LDVFSTHVAAGRLADAAPLGPLPVVFWLVAAGALAWVRRHAPSAPAAPSRWLASGVLALIPAASVSSLFGIEACMKALDLGTLSAPTVLLQQGLLSALFLLGPGWIALRTLDEARTLPAAV
jgi:hypothetical protein